MYQSSKMHRADASKRQAVTSCVTDATLKADIELQCLTVVTYKESHSLATVLKQAGCARNDMCCVQAAVKASTLKAKQNFSSI